MNDEISKIKSQANIVDIVRSYDINLVQKGKNYFGVCPFHEDHSPSMSVSEEKQIYKCFSCGASGNVFTFVSEYENVSFIEAVKIVAEKIGSSFHGNVTYKKTTPHEEEYAIMSLAIHFYQNNLNTKNGEKAREYLNSRSLGPKVIKDFDLGLALNHDYPLNKLLLSKNYKASSLINLGLAKENGNYLNDVFQNRIIFPIHDLDGNPVGFTGRIYENTDQARYINTKESPIFKKGQILFNYHRAKTEIKKQKEVIIVEGNMDAIRLFSVGIKNVVALMGTALTSNQVAILKNLRAKIILMFDNDEAGELATLNNGDILLTNNLSPFVVRLSGEKDPDEYIIKNGVAAIKNNLNNPLTFLDFKLKYYKKNKDLTKTTDLVTYIKDITNALKDIDDDLTRTITLKKMSTEYDIPLDLLERELGKIKEPKPKKQPPATPKVLSKYELVCENILYFMMNDYKYINKFQKDLGYFSIKKYRTIANDIIYYYDTYKDINLSDFITYITTHEYLYDDTMAIIKNNNIEELTSKTFEDLLKTASIEEAKITIKNLKNEMHNELDEEKKAELALKIFELKKGSVGNE